MKHYSRFFSQEERNMVGSKVILEEVNSVLKIFSKEKIPGTDGYSSEFFLCFLDILGKYLLDIAEYGGKKNL